MSASPEPAADGAVVAGVRAQLDGLNHDRPALAAIALVLAADLDNPNAVPQHPALAHRLREILENLSKASPRRGRLTAVRSMTGKA